MRKTFKRLKCFLCSLCKEKRVIDSKTDLKIGDIAYFYLIYGSYDAAVCVSPKMFFIYEAKITSITEHEGWFSYNLNYLVKDLYAGAIIRREKPSIQSMQISESNIFLSEQDARLHLHMGIDELKVTTFE